MAKNHFKDEGFLSINSGLWDLLEGISNKLKNNMLTEGRSHCVETILNHTKDFNSLWENVKPNNHDNMRLKNEYTGIYAFAEVKSDEVTFQYIGISRTIRERFRQHVKQTDKRSATWAWLMVREENKDPVKKIASDEFQKKAKEKITSIQKERMYRLMFTFVPIDEGDSTNMLLHLAEVYCVNRLQAHWNSFKTH